MASVESAIKMLTRTCLDHDSEENIPLHTYIRIRT